jgi:hypothetical protein
MDEDDDELSWKMSGDTARVDAHLWQGWTEALCEFTLEVAEACSAQK